MTPYTTTAYPTSPAKFNPVFRGFHYASVACGDNLDAPDFILRGDLFWGTWTHEALPAVAYSRG